MPRRRAPAGAVATARLRTVAHRACSAQRGAAPRSAAQRSAAHLQRHILLIRHPQLPLLSLPVLSHSILNCACGSGAGGAGAATLRACVCQVWWCSGACSASVEKHRQTWMLRPIPQRTNHAAEVAGFLKHAARQPGGGGLAVAAREASMRGIQRAGPQALAWGCVERTTLPPLAQPHGCTGILPRHPGACLVAATTSAPADQAYRTHAARGPLVKGISHRAKRGQQVGHNHNRQQRVRQRPLRQHRHRSHVRRLRSKWGAARGQRRAAGSGTAAAWPMAACGADSVARLRSAVTQQACPVQADEPAITQQQPRSSTQPRSRPARQQPNPVAHRR